MVSELAFRPVSAALLHRHREDPTPIHSNNPCLFCKRCEIPQLGAHLGKSIADPGEESPMGAVRKCAAEHFQYVLSRINRNQECAEVGARGGRQR